MANHRKALYSIFREVKGDISLHTRKKYVRPRYERMSPFAYPEAEAVKMWPFKLRENIGLVLRKVK